MNAPGQPSVTSGVLGGGVLKADDYAAFLDREYLAQYVPAGGAAVLVEHVSSVAEFHDRETDVSLNPKGNEPHEKYLGFGKKLTDN